MNSGSWFGSTLAASNTTLYACGFKDGFDKVSIDRKRSPGSFYSGTCYTVPDSSAMSKYITFVRQGQSLQYRYTPTSQKTVWKISGRYAFSATVDGSGNLVLGASTKAFDNTGYKAQPWKSTGNIARIPRAKFLEHPVE